MNLLLTPLEARVLACLVEKAITTPDAYPLSLNALTAACNQKSNRDPVLQATECEIGNVLDSLREKRLIWQVDTAGGRVPKYQHRLADVYALPPVPLAVLCELVLRGPQTVGELRTRASRMAAVAGLAEIEAALAELETWPGEPLVCRLARQPGRREERYAHRLCGEPAAPVRAAAIPAAPQPPVPALTPTPDDERLAALKTEIADLRAEVDALKRQLADFVSQFQ